MLSNPGRGCLGGRCSEAPDGRPGGQKGPKSFEEPSKFHRNITLTTPSLHHASTVTTPGQRHSNTVPFRGIQDTLEEKQRQQAFASLMPRLPGRGPECRPAWELHQLSAATGELLLLHADLFEERLHPALLPEELLNGYVHVARIARLVDLQTQSAAGRLVEVAVGRMFEDRRHVRRNRVRPGVAIIAGGHGDGLRTCA